MRILQKTTKNSVTNILHFELNTKTNNKKKQLESRLPTVLKSFERREIQKQKKIVTMCTYAYKLLIK